MEKLVRGGQVSIHKVRMLAQIMQTSFVLTIIAFVISFILSIYLIYPYSIFKDFQIYLVGLSLKKINLTDFNFQLYDTYTSVYHVLNSSRYIKSYNQSHSSFSIALQYATISACISLTLTIIIFYIKGVDSFNKKELRGNRLITSQALKKYIKRNPYSFYRLADVPYPKDGETLHTMICGSTGSGKTVSISHLVNQIKQRGDKAIIFDKMCFYTSKFYNYKTDIILNPFDKRSPNWNIFNEVKTGANFDTIATAFIPTEKGTVDPFWTKAARTIFAEVCSSLLEKGGSTNQALVNMLLKVNLSEVSSLVKGTAAQAILDEQSPKTALSVMSMLSTYLKCFKYLKDEGEQFSIRDWVLDETQNGCLFITSKGDLHSSLMPLISGWLEIAINNLL